MYLYVLDQIMPRRFETEIIELPITLTKLIYKSPVLDTLTNSSLREFSQ